LNALATKPSTPTKAKALFLGWFADSAFTTSWDFAKDAVTKDITLHVKWLEHLKFTFDGPAVNTLKLNVLWTLATRNACEYSTDGINYAPFSMKEITFPATNAVYFGGDCRDVYGRLDYMFTDTFKAYSGNVKVSGGVAALMGGVAPIDTKDSQFRHMFKNNNISEISPELFFGIEGTPKAELFKNVLSGNKLSAIPDSLFAGIAGVPAREAFNSAFASNAELSTIGDLGMNITGAIRDIGIYTDMFKDAGTASSVTAITAPTDGLIAIFTNEPTTFTSLDELYTGVRTNGAFSGAAWSAKYAESSEIPSLWK
jgi:hypothetical protein